MWAAEDYFRIDMAEVGNLIAPGKSHCMTYRREAWRYVKDPSGGYRQQHFTRWVAARLTRRAPDKLTVQITHKMSPDRDAHRIRILVDVAHKPSAVGGSRALLKCPDCRKPVRILYLARWLHCRRCSGLKNRSNLTFKTQRQMKRERDLSLALGGNGDPKSWVPDERPRYMHRTRHAALMLEYVQTHVRLNIIRKKREERRLRSVLRMRGISRLFRLRAG